MPTLGMPTPMFLIFVATVVAGSVGAVHYVIFHVILGRPFAETPPPVLRGSEGPGAPDRDRGGDPAAASGPEPGSGGDEEGGASGSRPPRG